MFNKNMIGEVAQNLLRHDSEKFGLCCGLVGPARPALGTVGFFNLAWHHGCVYVQHNKLFYYYGLNDLAYTGHSFLGFSSYLFP